MKYTIILLLIAALQAIAQSGTEIITVNKVKNYYFDADSTYYAYCTPADADKEGCVCSTGQIYVNGYCITNDDASEHNCNTLKPGMTTQRTCGDFGSVVEYCSSTADNKVSLVTESKCFNNEDLEYGVHVIYSMISFTNLPVYGINSESKAKIISGLVSVFPFMIGDVIFGTAYLSSESSIDQAPTTILEAEIITQKKYTRLFEVAQDNNEENGPASLFTEFLHKYADTYFAPCVEASFELMRPETLEISCDYGTQTYGHGDVTYRECSEDPANENSIFIGHEKQTCTATNGGTWSDFSTSECLDLQAYREHKKNVAVWDISFTNLPYSLLTYNLTKALYPIFIEQISSDIRGMKIFDLTPKLTKETNGLLSSDHASSRLYLVFDTLEDCVSEGRMCIEVANERIENNKVDLINKIREIDSSKLSSVTIDISFNTMKTSISDVSCVDDEGNTYGYNAVLYSECIHGSYGEGAIVRGHESRVCTSNNGNASWSDYILTECIDINAFAAGHLDVLVWDQVYDLSYGIFTDEILESYRQSLISDNAKYPVSAAKVFDSTPKLTKQESGLLVSDVSGSRYFVIFGTESDCVFDGNSCIDALNSQYSESTTGLREIFKLNAPTEAPTAAPVVQTCTDDNNIIHEINSLVYGSCRGSNTSKIVGHYTLTCLVSDGTANWDNFVSSQCLNIDSKATNGYYDVILEVTFDNYPYASLDSDKLAIIEALFTATSGNVDGTTVAVFDVTPKLTPGEGTAYIADYSSSRFAIKLESLNTCKALSTSYTCTTYAYNQININKAQLFSDIKAIDPSGFADATITISMNMYNY